MSASAIPVIGLAIILFFNPSEEKSSAPIIKKSTTASAWSVANTKVHKDKKAAKDIEIGYSHYNAQKEYNTILEFIQSRYTKISAEDADSIANYLVEYGKKHDLDPKFVAAVIARESAFNKKAISRTGAKGLGQIKDFNFKSLKIDNPYAIDQNVSGTTEYLKRLVKRWKEKSNKTELALASYYKGPNAVARAGGKVDKETQRYVNDIMGYYDEIKTLYKNKK